MPRGRPVKCPYCSGTDTTSKGARKTKTMGIRKIRRCKSCGRRFTARNQKLVQHEDSEAPQAGTTEPVQHEAVEAAQGDTSEPAESDRAEPIDVETSASVELDEPSDEHPRLSL